MVYHYKKKKNVFEELKLAIMQGIYNPRERLIERTLAAQFGVSRTPVREAVRKLEAIGMVRIVRNQGAMVADFTPDEIEALYLVRMHLEKLAGKLASLNISSPGIKTLKAIHQDLIKAAALGDVSKMVEGDQKFHLTLLGFCRNAYLMRTIEELRLKSLPITFCLWKKTKADVRTSISQHKAMIEALRNKDIEKWNSLVEKQMNTAKNTYLAFISTR